MKQNKGFTLIELLIVVAIIAILAAIAVPNFLEAQTRAKVSRVKSDLRTLATAIESYIVDNNNPPPEAGARNATGVFAARTIDGKSGQTGILGVAISTPIAYITSSDFRDPFFSNDSASRPDVALYTYKAYKWEWPNNVPLKADNQPIDFNEGANLTGTEFQRYYGAWRIFSVGPDRDWDNDPNNPKTAFANPARVGIPYDATNGTVSVGSIIRSQSESEQKSWKVW